MLYSKMLPLTPLDPKGKKVKSLGREIKEILNNSSFGSLECIWFVKMKPLITKPKAGWHSDRMDSEAFT